MTILKFLATSFGLASLSILPFEPALASAVTLEANLGQSIIHSKSSDRIYLRLALKGAALPGRDKRTPINVALVVDRSGSMAGDRIAAAKEALHVALERLSANDIVSVVSYNHKVDVLHAAAPLGTSRDSLLRVIDKLEADGTTALYAGTEEGGKQVEKFLSDTKVNRVVLVSDGLANVGPSTPKDAADLGRRLAGKGISVTTIGLGLDYNEDLMQRLASASDGNHAFVEHPRQLASIFDKEFGDALSITAQDITIIIECKAGFKAKRVLGRDAEISGNRVTIKLNQLQADNERYVVLEVDVPAGSTSGSAEVASVEIEYLDLATSSRTKSSADVTARISDDEGEANASVNKSVMTQVTEQIATETSEKAVELRDAGDITNARKMLEDNAAYLNKQKSALGSGPAPAPAKSVEALDELEKKSREAATNLDGNNWEKTRKGMRYDQHKSKVQQKY